MNTKTASLNKVDSSARSKSYAAIKQALYANGPLSRSQLASVTGLLTSSVCGRVNELIKLGQVQVAGEVYDTNTKRNVEVVDLVQAAA